MTPAQPEWSKTGAAAVKVHLLAAGSTFPRRRIPRGNILLWCLLLVSAIYLVTR